MNIPYSILEEKTFISKSCYDYHQSLAKKYYISNKKNKSSNQTKSNKNSKKKIFNWFFTLDIKEKIKICSIYNNWFIRILDQLLIYNYYDNSIRFIPKEIYGNFYKMLDNSFEEENYDYKNYLKNLAENYENNEFNPEKYFSTFFAIDEYDRVYAESNKNLYVEREFLNELRFFSLNEYNDILSLNEELLNNKQKLQEYFDKFSDCNIFKENIIVIKAKPNCNNIFNFSFPNWVKNMEKFSIQQLIVICFEISISIYYQIFLAEQSIPSFDIDSKIEDLFNMKMTMENYISKEVNKGQNKINSILEKKEIDKEISSDVYNKLFVEHENITEFVYKFAFNHNQSSFYTDPTITDENINNALKNLRKDLNTNIPQFVHNITFIKSQKVFKIENIVYNIIYQKILTLCSERNLEEIYMDINETPTIKKKKKKNKKNKEKKEENDAKEKNENNKDNKDKNNSIKIEINNYEENEFHNINDNKFSINAEDNKNNSNISEDEEDEENQIFSNDYYNEIENSKNIKNINNDEESIKECIEMKLLDDKGREIFNEGEKEKEEDKNKIDLIEELLKENKQEKKNNNNPKKKKKHKIRKKKTTQEENNNEIKKKEEIKEEPKVEEEKIVNKITLNTSEIKSNININTNIKEINIENIDHKKEENKNRKKHKEFFLYPVEKKKNKNINNNSNHKNSNTKNFSKKEDNNLSIKKESSKDNISETSATEKKEVIEKNEKININNEININDKSFDFSEIKESKIQIIENKNIISDNAIEKSNKIEHSIEHSKIQNINLNNSTINNYVIIDKYPPNKLLSLEHKEFQKNIYPQIISSYNYSMPFHQLPNYYLYERNDLFNDLTEEILTNEENITNNLSLLEKYRKEIYQKIKSFIENVLYKNNFKVKLIKYGSHETGLSIESSDIDILIKFCKADKINNIGTNNQQNIEEILALIYNELNNKKEKFNIIQINAIYTASVPVLKIKFNLENIIPNEIIKKIKENYIFNFEEDILQLNFDFTFQEVEKIDEIIKIPSLEIISLIRRSLSVYKEIKPIILILKRFMKINKLNSSFHGGLSSYSLFLLLYSYIKYMFLPTNSLGHYLYGFFEFYSNFNFGIYYINPILDCPFMILDELHESGMMLIDPITSLNVAKSTFRIDQIKSVLTKGMIIIRNIFFTNKGKDYIHNLNSDKNIFLKELFKNRNGTMIVEKIFQQIQIQNQQVIGNWKNI